MIWIIAIVTGFLIAGFLRFKNMEKNEAQIINVIDSAVRWGYVMLQVFLVLFGVVFFVFVGMWVLG